MVELEALKRLVEAGDYFAVLGVPHRFDVDLGELRKNYLALSRATHPDFFANEPEKIGEAMGLSAAVNEAFRTLEDPVRRAEYVLLRHGGKQAGEDKRVPPEMLAEVMMMREEIEEAKASGDGGTLQVFRQQMMKRRQDVLVAMEELARKLTANGDGKGDEGTRDALRLELNAMKYVENLLGQL